MVSYNGRTKSSRAIFLTVLIAILMCVPISAMGRMVGQFEGNQASVTVDFATAGSVDSAAVIPWNYTAKTLHATMNVSSAPHTDSGTDYPLAPSINVAGQGTPDWAFQGTGYGAFGYQSGFQDESKAYSTELIEAGKAAPPGILLPTGASITDGKVQIKGDTAKVNYSDNYFANGGAYRVAFSKNFNTLFIGGPYFGVVARNLNDGSVRRISPDTYPGIPEWTVEDIKYDDVDDLLFIATLGGLQIIDYRAMEPVEVINRYSDINTLSNSIYSVDFDPVTGILAIGESGDIAIINYTSRTKLAYVDLSWAIAYNVELDIANMRLWAATSWSAVGVDLTNYQVKYKYTTTSTPPLPTSQAQDITYDAAHDRLFVGTRGGATSGLTIISVQAATKVDVTDATTPALTNRNVWALSYDNANDLIYIGTDWCVNVLTPSPLAVATTYSTVTTPPIVHTYDQDVLYVPGKNYMAVANWLGASLIDVGKHQNILDYTNLLGPKMLPSSGFYDINVDNGLNLAFVSLYYGVISIVNLTTGNVDANLTATQFLGGFQSCSYLLKTKYDEARHWLLSACYSGNNPYHASLGIYNVSSKTFYKYYDEGTTPGLQPTAGYTGIIYGFDYDSASNQVVVAQTNQGITLLNMTSNSTVKYNSGSTPSVPNTWGLYDVTFIAARQEAAVANYGYGVNIFNFSAGTRTDIRTSTNPALTSNSIDKIGSDPKKAFIYVGGYGGFEAFDISNVASIKVLGRFNSGTNPAMPVTYYYQVQFDAKSKLVYTSSLSGAYCIDVQNAVIAKHYTTTTSPALFQTTAYAYTNYKPKDWDILATWNAVQIIKHDPTPMDVELWIGDQMVWKQTGNFNTTATVSNLAQAVQGALKTAYQFAPDQYGVTMARLDLKLVTQRAGTLTLGSISLEYSYIAKTPDFSAAINDYLLSVGPGWDNRVPITVTSASAGKVILGKLNVEIDEAPFFLQFPKNLTMLENTFQTKLLDINNYVTDDFDLKTDLKYTASALTNGTRVNVGIFEGHYLYIDSMTKPASVNWTGTVSIDITATDTSGLSRTSDPFPVKVEPLHAIVITSIPVTVVFEDQAYTYDVDAVSHRALPLTYKLDKAPAGMKIDPVTGMINWTPANADVGNHVIAINVTDGNESAYQTYGLTVINVNDQPQLSPIAEITAYEGVKKVVDLSKYITDADDPEANLSVMVKSSYASVNGLTVTFLYPLKSGITQENVSFTVSDGKALVQGLMKVKVLGVFKVDRVPDQTATEGTLLRVNLATYIHDPQAKKLTYTLFSKYAKVNGTAIDIMYPIGSKVLDDNITVRFSDGTAINDTTMTFKVKVVPVFPTVTITTPSGNQKYSGTVTVSGSAVISSGQVTKVMVKVDNGDWVQATGTGAWTYEFKVKDLKLADGIHNIYVQSFSGNVSSPVAMKDFSVKNQAPTKLSSEGYLGIGLIIGIIIALIIGLVAYRYGKRKSGPVAGVEEHAATKSFDHVDEQRPTTRPSRPPRTPPPVKEETPEPPAKEPQAEPAPEKVPEAPKEEVPLWTPVEEAKPEAPKEEPSAEAPKEEAKPPEERPEPGPPKDEKPEVPKEGGSKETTDTALADILRKLDK